MTETLNLTKALIACPSITPKDEGAQNIIAQRLKNIGFEIEHFQINETNNLWAKRGNGKPLFCFAGHTDVVPTGPGWRFPPFTPTIENGMLYGRGAADMKSSLAAMVVACEHFIAQYPQAENIAFLITSDEEGPALDGTQAVLKILAQRDEIPQWCLVGEPSSTEVLGDVIKVGRRGSLGASLTILGTQGHVAYPHLAKNPIHLSFKPLQAIIDYSWDEARAPFPATTLQISNIQAGTGATNVIPGSIKADFNLRFSPQITIEHIQQTIENILKTHDCEYEITWNASGKPFYTPPTSQLIQATVTAITEKTGKAPELSTSGGTSDGRFFAQYGCEVVELGPVNRTIHQINECTNIAELETLTAFYESILATLFSATLSRR